MWTRRGSEITPQSYCIGSCESLVVFVFIVCGRTLFFFQGLVKLTHAVQEYCDIGDSGACGVGEGLKSNSILQTLWLVSVVCCLFATIHCLCFD